MDLLNSCLANSLDLFMQAKVAHWNVQGPAFFSWHKLFDEVAEHLRKQSDLLAERATTLGGYAEGTARQVARHSGIAEYDHAATGGPDHIATLADRLGVHAASLRSSIMQVRQEPMSDPVTENVLINVLEEVETDIWFLESHLQETHRGRRAEMEESDEAEETEDRLFPT